MIRKLEEDKNFYMLKEQDSSSYVAAIDEEPVIPDYDFTKINEAITEIDRKIVNIKHEINLSNCTNTISVNGKTLTIDRVLIEMAQLSRRKQILDSLRKMEPKSRVDNSGYYSSKKSIVEYRYINFDLAEVQKQYDQVDALLAEMQVALDKYNQTFEFEIEV